MGFNVLLKICASLVMTVSHHSASPEDHSNLRIVHVIWRHGARAPLHLFPLDADVDIKKWPNGLAELTPEGIMQQYELGEKLRERYRDFISEYNADLVYVGTIDSNRSIISALANLAGMFPPVKGYSPFNSSWQSIPIHTVPHRFDKILDVKYSVCPYSDSIFYEEVMTSDPVKKIMNKNAKLFDFLRNQTGLKLSIFTDIFDVYDPLNCERFHYKENSARSWVSEELFHRIENLFKLSTLYYYSHPIIRKFRGGPLLEDVATLLIRKANGDLNEQLKYVAYSAHGTTLISLLTNLNVYNVTLVPRFSACIMFELYFVNGSYIVELWYKNGVNEEPYRISLPGCPDPCDVRTFTRMAAGKAPKDWDTECLTPFHRNATLHSEN